MNEPGKYDLARHKSPSSSVVRAPNILSGTRIFFLCPMLTTNWICHLSQHSALLTSTGTQTSFSSVPNMNNVFNMDACCWMKKWYRTFQKLFFHHQSSNSKVWRCNKEGRQASKPYPSINYVLLRKAKPHLFFHFELNKETYRATFVAASNKYLATKPNYHRQSLSHNWLLFAIHITYACLT